MLISRRVDKKKKMGPRKPRIFKKKKCRFCGDDKLEISYLDVQFLRKFITERGKIVPSRFSGNCARHQRKVTAVIKRARNAGILPYLAE